MSSSVTPGSRFLAILVLFAASCSGPAPLVPKSTVVESGAPEQPFDATGIGWVTAFRAEALGGGSGSWQTDLRLANGTRLLIATGATAEIRFPPGFALPLAQILRDVPETWRGTTLDAVAEDAGASPPQLRTTIEYLPAQGHGEPPNVKRLYVLSLPVTEGEGQLEEPRARWQVPAGEKLTRRKYTFLVPVDSTVHYGVAKLRDMARYVRLTDTGDGKVLWQADPVLAPGTRHIASIPAYASETGFPLYRDHEYEIEVLYDNPGPEPITASAELFLYYRPPGTEEFSYPYPPPGESPAR